jgi:hypothetical protein
VARAIAALLPAAAVAAAGGGNHDHREGSMGGETSKFQKVLMRACRRSGVEAIALAQN